MIKIHLFLTSVMILSCALVIKANADNGADHHEKPHVGLVGAIDRFELLEAPLPQLVQEKLFELLT